MTEDGRGTEDGGKWKIGQCSGRPETTKDALMQKPLFRASATTAAACALQKIKTKQAIFPPLH